MADERIEKRVTGHFKLGERVLVFCPSLPDFCGPAEITEKEYRVGISSATGRPVTGWVYRTDRMPPGEPDAWWSESVLRQYPEPAEPAFIAQLQAALGVAP